MQSWDGVFGHKETLILKLLVNVELMEKISSHWVISVLWQTR